MAEARAIVRQRMGSRRKLEDEDFQELTMLIATRYQVAKETYNRQEKRLATFKARDKRLMKDNLRELCQEIEAAMASAPSPVLAASTESGASRANSRLSKAGGAKATGRIYGVVPTQHLTAQEIANLSSTTSAPGMANWMGLLKNRIGNLTSAYGMANTILEKKTQEEAARIKAEKIAQQEKEKEMSKKRFKLPSDSSVGEDVNMSEIDKLAAELNAKEKAEASKAQKKAVSHASVSSRHDSLSSVKHPNLRKASIVSSKKQFRHLNNEHASGTSVGVKSSTSSIQTHKQSQLKTNTSSERTSHHVQKQQHKKAHDVITKLGGSNVSVPEKSQTHSMQYSISDSDHDRHKSISKMGRRESGSSWNNPRSRSRNKNVNAKEPPSKYKEVAIDEEDKQAVKDQIRKDAIRLKKINRTLENMRKAIGENGPRAGFKKMESQYWKARCDVLRKSKSVGYYYFLSEHRREKCDACHDGPVRDVPVTESKTTLPVSKYCREMSFLHYESPSRVVPELRKVTFKGKQVDPHDLMNERYFLKEEEARCEFPQEFDDESCPGATTMPDGRKRCIACASANKDLPNLYDGLVAPHGEHHFYVPPLVSRAVPMRRRLTELSRMVTEPQIPMTNDGMAVPSLSIGVN